MEDKTLEGLDLITQALVSAGIASPIVIPFIFGLAYMIKGLSGGGISLTALANRMEASLDVNDAFGHAELERLRAMVA